MENMIPVQSPNDSRKYRIIRLDNDLKALLVSDSLPIDQASDNDDKPLVNGFVNDSDKADVLCDVYNTNDGSSIGTESGESESESESESGNSGTSASSGQNFGRSKSSGKKSNINKASAVSLCVGVGSFSDPEDVPGLAHCLEHMVFMGSKKYPKESGMDGYLGARGGSNDAYTDCEHTIFSLDVEQKHFEGAMDRFAQFFVEPLLRKDAIDREIEAVDSEFDIGLPCDKNRIEQLFGNIARSTHPMSKFIWGNAETLRTKPKAAGIDVHARLQAFRKRYYVGQNMTLAVQSREPLDVLEMWVRNIFSVIPSSSDPKPSFIHLNPPYEMSSFNKLYKIVPVKKVNRVMLTWCLPSEQPHYRSKPLSYLGWLLGHEGKGSIAAYLSKRHWKYDLEAGCEESETGNNSCCCFFQVSITLSDDGLSHLFEVVTTVFDYIAMLRSVGPSRRIFDEIKTIEDNRFRWIEETDAQDYVQELSVAMQLYQDADYLTGDTLYMEYNDELIRECTNALTPNKMNLMVLSKSFQDSAACDKECMWFKTRYGCEDIPSKWIQRWTAPELNSELQLPPPNVYIATDFTLKEADVPESEFPVLISETPISKLWYRKDQTFKVPRAYIYIYLTSCCINRSAKSICMTDLLVKLLEKSLDEVAYDAHEADLGYSITVDLSGIVIKLSGFNEKIGKLFRIIVDHFIDLKFSEKDFESAADEWKTIYHNHSLKAARLNTDLRLSILVHNHWTMMERLSILPSISTRDVEDFFKEFLSETAVEMLVQGNYTAQEAKDLECWLLGRLGACDRSPPPSCPSTCASSSSVNATQSSYFVTELPDGALIHRTKNLNGDDDNCVISNYYQHGPATLRQQQMMELLLMQLETPLFDILRTKRQLGYDVSCSARDTHGVIGYSVTIGSQSTKFSMKRLDSEIEGFLSDRMKKLDRWCSEGSFNRMVQSQIIAKQSKDVNLEQEVERNWEEITDGSYLFNRLQREIEELKQITLPEFRAWCTNHLLEGVERRKISIQVVGNTIDPKKTSSAPSMFKRSGSGLDAAKKKQSRMSNTSAQSKKPPSTKRLRNEDAIPKKSRDASGNVFVKDVHAFKSTCKKYPASQIV